MPKITFEKYDSSIFTGLFFFMWDECEVGALSRISNIPMSRDDYETFMQMQTHVEFKKCIPTEGGMLTYTIATSHYAEAADNGPYHKQRMP